MKKLILLLVAFFSIITVNAKNVQYDDTDSTLQVIYVPATGSGYCNNSGYKYTNTGNDTILLIYSGTDDNPDYQKILYPGDATIISASVDVYAATNKIKVIDISYNLIGEIELGYIYRNKKITVCSFRLDNGLYSSGMTTIYIPSAASKIVMGYRQIRQYENDTYINSVLIEQKTYWYMQSDSPANASSSSASTYPLITLANKYNTLDISNYAPIDDVIDLTAGLEDTNSENNKYITRKTIENNKIIIYKNGKRYIVR